MNGHIKRITDNDIQSSVLEIMSTNISTTFITCPADPQKTLGIKLPFLVMIIKNVRRRRRCCEPACLLLTLPPPPLPCAAEEVLHVRGASARRQERAPALPRLQLPGAPAHALHWFCVASVAGCRGSIPRSAGSELVDTALARRAPRVSSRSSALCPCALTRAGTRFSSTSATSRGVRTAFCCRTYAYAP